MRIGVESQFQIFVALLRFPDRREREKETLLRRVAVDFFIAIFRMFIERLLQRGVSELYTTDVGDVLALCQFTVHVQSRQRFVFTVLLYDCSRAFLEFFRGLRRPPVGQISHFVVLPALIVEAMRHFVADDGADAAIIHRVVRVRVEERWLQNSGRENNLVHLRIVVGVHRRRRHSPFGAIDRLADFVQLAFRFKILRSQLIQHEWPAIDHQGRIIAPLFRVTDLHLKRGQFFQRRFFGGLVHPLECLDPIRQCFF